MLHLWEKLNQFVHTILLFDEVFEIIKQNMTSYLHYRGSTLGISLTEALDDLIQKGQITPQLAVRVLLQYDQSITEALANTVRTKMAIKAHLNTYRFCDEVWTFILKNPTIKMVDGGLSKAYVTPLGETKSICPHDSFI